MIMGYYWVTTTGLLLQYYWGSAEVLLGLKHYMCTTGKLLGYEWGTSNHWVITGGLPYFYRGTIGIILGYY